MQVIDARTNGAGIRAQIKWMESEANSLHERMEAAGRGGYGFAAYLSERKVFLLEHMCADGGEGDAQARIADDELRVRMETVMAVEHLWLGGGKSIDLTLKRGRDGMFHVRLNIAVGYDWNKWAVHSLLRPEKEPSLAAGV